MANDIVYEQDYREVHKIMTARTYTEEKEEAFQLALLSLLRCRRTEVFFTLFTQIKS